MKTAGVISSFAFALVIAGGLTDSAPDPFFEGLGSHTRKISTKSPEAQKYFDQGFELLFGFNHGAAIWAFQAAVSKTDAQKVQCWQKTVRTTDRHFHPRPLGSPMISFQPASVWRRKTSIAL
jgi:hypothetical protein